MKLAKKNYRIEIRKCYKVEITEADNFMEVLLLLIINKHGIEECKGFSKSELTLGTWKVAFEDIIIFNVRL